jgi:hypothetical protein
VITHNKADQLKAKLTQTSATFNLLAIDGKVDCIAVFPAAATSITKNKIMMRPVGIVCDILMDLAANHSCA